MKASIIVSDTTSQGKLLLAINSLCAQTLAENEYEIILPDLGNFSREERAILSEIQKDRPSLKILQSYGNRAEKINNAAAKAKGDILLFIESHCIAAPDWASKLLALFKNPKILAAQGTIRSVSSESIVSNAESISRQKAQENRKILKIESVYFDFHNSAVRKSVWNQLNGLDTEFPTICEFDFGARINESGIKIHQQVNNAPLHLNDRNPASYAQIIARQSFEKSVIFSKRGEAFFSKYFPSPTFTRNIFALRLARAPIKLILMTRLLLEFFLLAVAKQLKTKTFGHRVFETFAKDSHRYGMIKGLSKRMAR